MLSNAEITEIIEAVNNEEYTIVEALDELAKAAKGEDVRRALYATAYVLNKEGHSGSIDIVAREGLATLESSVNDEISDFEEDINGTVSSIQTTVNNIDTTRRALVIDTLYTSADGQGRINASLELSHSIADYDYIAIQVMHYAFLLPLAYYPVDAITVGTTNIRLGSVNTKDGALHLRFTDNTHLKIINNICYSADTHSSYAVAPDISQGEGAILNMYMTIRNIFGIKTL